MYYCFVSLLFMHQKYGPKGINVFVLASITAGINPFSGQPVNHRPLEVIIWAAVFTETTVFHCGSNRLFQMVVRTIKHISSNRNQEL
jgi:hypothetical protein